jgi:hypothetical protein
LLLSPLSGAGVPVERGLEMVVSSAAVQAERAEINNVAAMAEKIFFMVNFSY